jgi:two-component system nitrate/nitrite response regulator NarL
VEQELEPDELQRANAEGRAMDYPDVVQLCRSVLEPSPVAEPSNTSEHPSASQLSAREIDVIRELAHGKSNAQIAETLFISVPTVKVHVRSILTKLNVTSRTAAAAYAINERI